MDTKFKKGDIPWNKGLTKEECPKLSNAGTKKGNPAWNKGKEHLQISKEKHWNWQGGITNKRDWLRFTKDWKEWRKVVFERDNYTCQNINCHFCDNKKGIKLHPHHIIPKEECLDLDFEEMIFNVDNGITYCEDYHLKSNLHKDMGD